MTTRSTQHIGHSAVGDQGMELDSIPHKGIIHGRELKIKGIRMGQKTNGLQCFIIRG